MKQHILIADSGSTKTEWDLDGLRIKTQGINPFHQDDDTIRAILCDELLPQLYSHCSVSEFSSLKVSFYGSGVRPELEEKIVRLLSEAFPEAKQIDAHSDLLGAAIALCGHSEGIACILGTGANSCLFDGQRIVKNTPPMGYVLGDEGSGAVLGIRFLNALYKDRLPHTILSDFEAYIGMNLAQVIDRVYRQPLANRWLASLSEFIHAHMDEPLIEALGASREEESCRQQEGRRLPQRVEIEPDRSIRDHVQAIQASLHAPRSSDEQEDDFGDDEG